MNADTNRHLLDRLAQSRIYRDYERAFAEATGLPLTLSPVDNWHLAHRGRQPRNPFCALIARNSKACLACRQTQHTLTSSAREQSCTVRCFAGMSETAVPLRVGDRLVGFLRTGEVFLQRPAADDFSRVVRQLEQLGVKVNPETLRAAYFQVPVLPEKRYESVLTLLQIFAEHLSIVAGQLVFQSEHSERPDITKAREYISAHHAEDLTLASVAQAVHMSTFYFCKQFKKATGLSFTEYLGRVRVEKAKERLLEPHVRVSEVAYDVGFQSLTHFNRVFKKVNGESPTTYRAHLPLACAA